MGRVTAAVDGSNERFLGRATAHVGLDQLGSRSRIAY